MCAAFAITIVLSDFGETVFVIAVPAPSRVNAIAIDAIFLVMFFMCFFVIYNIFKAKRSPYTHILLQTKTFVKLFITFFSRKHIME